MSSIDFVQSGKQEYVSSIITASDSERGYVVAMSEHDMHMMTYKECAIEEIKAQPFFGESDE